MQLDRKRGEEMSKIIGIDLGTTNSAIAVFEASKPVLIPNSEGHMITPSIVALSDQGEWLVGEPAKRQAIANPGGTVSSIKRQMGSAFRAIPRMDLFLPISSSD